MQIVHGRELDWFRRGGSPKQARAVRAELCINERVDRFDDAGTVWGRRAWAEAVEMKIEELASYLREDQQQMAKGKGDDKGKAEQIQWRGFVDIKLSDAQKDAFDKWDCHDDDVYDAIGAYVQGGYKLTCNYNPQNDTYSASFTGGAGTGDNAGFTLSCFAPSWYEALRLLLFKHNMIAQENWATAEKQVSRYG